MMLITAAMLSVQVICNEGFGISTLKYIYEIYIYTYSQVCPHAPLYTYLYIHILIIRVLFVAATVVMDRQPKPAYIV